MKNSIRRGWAWLGPLFTEADQITHNRIASMGRCMGWLTFFLDASIVIYIVRHNKVVPHADIIFNFLEVLTLFVLSFAFSHKLLLLKGKFSFPALDGGGSGGDIDGNPKQPVTSEPEK